MTTLGFPLDSAIVGYHDDGFPAYSNEYSSEDYREVISKLISNGVVAFSGGNSLRGASLQITNRNNTVEIHIEKGAAVINGAFFINKSTKKIYITAPTLQGSEKTKTKYTFVFVRFVKNSDGEDLDFYLQENFTAVVPTVNNSLLLGRVVSSTYDTNGELSYYHGYNDYRASEYCGFSVPFAEVDTSAYYDAVQQVVNESKAEVEATIPTLLENAQESVDSAISNLEEQTQTAVDLAQAAIDETLYAQLDTKIDGIEDKAPAYLKPMMEIPNGADLNDYKEAGAYFCRAENVGSVTNRYTQVIGQPFFLYVYENDFLDDDDATQSVIQHFIASYEYSAWRKVSYVNDSYSSKTNWLQDVRGSVTSDKIANNAIKTAKIADGAVTQDKLADDINLGGGEVEDGSITSTKIANGTIKLEDLSQEVLDAINNLALATYRDKFYPPGTYYFSDKNVSPASILGGKWTTINAGEVLRMANGTGTGGADSVSIAHTHGLSAGYGKYSIYQSTEYYKYKTAAQWSANYGLTNAGNASALTTSATSGMELGGTTDSGGTTSLSRLPAYRNVYAWRRDE